MLRTALTPVAALLLAGPLAAAPVPPRPKPDDTVSPSAVKLLKDRKVQKELKMSAENRVALIDALADIEEEYEKKIDQLAGLPNVPDDAFEKLEQEQEKAVGRALEAAAKALPGAQRARLRQLDRHVRGPAAFLDPQVQKFLQLTDAQKKKAADVAERTKAEIARFLDDPDEDEAKQKANLFAFRKERMKEMADALTAEQKTAWGELLGAAPTGFSAEEVWLRQEEEADEPPVPDAGK